MGMGGPSNVLRASTVFDGENTFGNHLTSVRAWENAQPRTEGKMREKTNQ